MAKQFGSQIDLQKIPVLNLVPYSSGTAPSSPVAGQLWWDSTNSQLKVCTNATGPVWTQCDNVTGGTASNVSDGDKGQITVTSGVWTIDAGVVTSAMITDGTIALGDLSFTPLLSGATAGGDLTGTYPNPTIGTGKVTSTAILDGTIAPGDLSFTSLPPNGAAGGDLTGTYPNPTIGSGKVTTSHILDGTVAIGDLNTSSVRLDNIGLPTAAVNMNGRYLQNLLDPVSSNDAATKNYVDLSTQGLDAKQSVRCASNGSNYNLASIGTVDGITVANGDRVLLKDQTSSAENGIYVIGGAAASRATDADAYAELVSAYVWVEAGTALKDTGWVCTSDQGGTLGSTAITWVQFSGAGSIIDGAGLIKTGNTFDVNTDGQTLEVAGDVVRVKGLGINTPQIAAGAITLASGILANASVDMATKPSGVLPIANGGTNANSVANAKIQLGFVSRYAADVAALTAGAELSITHTLGATDVQVQFRLNSNGAGVELAWRVIDATHIGVTADVGYAANALRIVIIG